LAEKIRKMFLPSQQKASKEGYTMRKYLQQVTKMATRHCGTGGNALILICGARNSNTLIAKEKNQSFHQLL
jgi:hypothetical protein